MQKNRAAPFIAIAALAMLDQIIKLIIHGSFMDAYFSIIPGVLRFEPVQNLNLAWLFSIADYTPPVAVMVLLDVAAAVLIFLLHRYLVYFFGGGSALFGLFRIFVFSGILCAFIDVVFWGGSIDYIGLFNWFTFDLKDAYLTVPPFLAVIEILRRNKEISPEQAKERGFLNWIKGGFPKLP